MASSLSLVLISIHISLAVELDGRVTSLALKWEPELYAELGVAPGEVRFESGLKTPCVNIGGVQRCVPGAFIIGNWQSNARSLETLIAAHPNVSSASRDRCWQSWTNDRGGRQWLQRSPPRGFDPRRHLMAALGCITALTYYPGFAGRFHKFCAASRCIDAPSKACSTLPLSTSLTMLLRAKCARAHRGEGVLAMQGRLHGRQSVRAVLL